MMTNSWRAEGDDGSLLPRGRVADAAGRGLHVMVLDDDPLCAASLEHMLTVAGIAVSVHGRADSALRQARSQPPDLAILDLDLPDMTGFEVVAALREEQSTQHVPVLVVSGHGDGRSRRAAFSAGADCFLAKPFSGGELRAIVDSLGRRGRELHDVASADAMIETLVEIGDMLMPEFHGHTRRVAHLAEAFGRELGLDADAVLALRRAGSLHDIGKVAIPRRILVKPGPLTTEEREVMKEHVDCGVRICTHLPVFHSVLPVIRHHHERWDGSGYPDGLAGEDIPLLARVFQVVDIYDALLSKRCYKRALPRREALAILEEETARGWWDARLVERFGAFVTGPRR